MTGNAEYGVLEVGTRLKNFIDEHDDICSEVKGTEQPLVILAFDEVHILTESLVDQGWTIYSELRHCLCQLVDLPIFTLFLLTVGKFRLFSLNRSDDLSSRVVHGHKRVLPPITETRFDQFALTATEDQTTLDQVIEDQWICSFGCPLYVFLACALFWRTHIILRVGLPPIMMLICKMFSFDLRLFSLLLRSCWVATRSSRQLTSPLLVYLCGSPWNLISQTQMCNPLCTSRSSITCDSAQ